MEKKKSRGERLDAELVRRGLAPSREKAQALIMAGQVLLAGQLADKPDRRVDAGALLELKRPFPYVSRGAQKLEAAVAAFGLDVRGRHVLDVGISTGGFSDFLLQRGAARITGVDVTVSQVAQKLQSDPRVSLLEKNARFLRREDVRPAPDLIVVDLSFISVRKVLPALAAFAPVPVLALIKPQFEAQRGRVGKGGVLRDESRRREVLLAAKRGIEALGFGLAGAVPAGIAGKSGNQEYFFLLQPGAGSRLTDEDLLAAVASG